MQFVLCVAKGFVIRSEFGFQLCKLPSYSLKLMHETLMQGF